MTIAICEDELPEAEELERRVSAFFRDRGYSPEIDLFGDCASLLASEKAYSLVLLDCLLPDRNGLEAARSLLLRKPRPVVVFVSAYGEYVFESFEVNAFRYLLKPVDDLSLHKTLNSFLAYYNANVAIDIPTKEKRLIVNLNDIIYIESSGKRTVVRLCKTDYLTETHFTSVRSLKEYTEMMDSPFFFQTHKRFLVNMRFIETVEDGLITLSVGERVEISRRKRASFEDAFNRFLRTSL